MTEREPVVEPLNGGDVALLRYMRESFCCRENGTDCPVLADCPEGFYICDALVNMLEPGMTPELGYAAKRAVRFLYDQLGLRRRRRLPRLRRVPRAERRTLRIAAGEAGRRPVVALTQTDTPRNTRGVSVTALRAG